MELEHSRTAHHFLMDYYTQYLFLIDQFMLSLSLILVQLTYHFTLTVLSLFLQMNVTCYLIQNFLHLFYFHVSTTIKNCLAQAWAGNLIYKQAHCLWHLSLSLTMQFTLKSLILQIGYWGSSSLLSFHLILIKDYNSCTENFLLIQSC